MDSQLKEILVPNFLRLLLIFGLSLGLLSFIHYPLLQQLLLKEVNISEADWRGYIDGYLGRIDRSRVSYFLTLGLFWGGVGLLFYLAVWSVINIAIEIRNLIVYEKFYIHHKISNLIQLRTLLGRIVLGTVTVGLLLITTKYGLPLWADIFSQAFFAGQFVSGLLSGLMAVVGFGVNLYLLHVGFKLFLLANN